MTNNLQNPELQTSKTTGRSILGEGAEKYIRDSANIEDLPGDDDDLEIEDEDDDDDEDIDNVDMDEDVDDVETEKANKEVAMDEEDEDYTRKDEGKRDSEERGLRS